MAEPFLAEIRVFSFSFAPKGWALCNGQLLPINQNQALFSLLGATYGGDGRVNFGLPNLQARMPMHVGSGHVLGERAGESAHALNITELPTHTHFATVASSATVASPTAAHWASPGKLAFAAPASLVAMNPATVGNTGGSQAHENTPPFLVVNFAIALQGIFPSQN